MDGSAVAEILAAAAPTFYKEGDVTFSSKPMTPIVPPVNPAIHLHGLASLWNYMESIKDADDAMLLIVRSHPQVDLVAADCDAYGRRECVAICENIGLGGFSFGTYMDQATIMTALQTQFVQNDGIEYLLKLLGSLADNNVIEGFDNGLSQSVTVKKSVASKGVEHVQRVVELRPYRTFIELEQPESPFIVRMKARENQLPLCALIETDGGKWKIGAMEKVRTYLNEAVKEIDAMSLFTVL